MSKSIFTDRWVRRPHGAPRKDEPYEDTGSGDPGNRTVVKFRYPLAQDTVDREDLHHLIEWLKTNPRLTKGEVTVAFENKWSRWLGRNYSVFCNSGSSANLLMFHTLLLSGRLRNKKVVVPSAGWSTSIAPAIQLGFEPLMCEADPDTFGLDLNDLEALLRQHDPGTVLVTHVLGVPHKMGALERLREKYGFILLEDACAAIGSSTEGKKVGSFGDLASFSFYFGHQISTIEGGMVSTDDPVYRDLLLMGRSHGWAKDLEPQGQAQLLDRYRIDGVHEPFVFYEPGFNLRSTDLNAFIGLSQVDKLDRIASRRHANHLRFKKLLGGTCHTQGWQDPESVISSISFCLVAASGEARRSIVAVLVENGIESRLFTAGNLGRHPFWFNRFGEVHLPFADRLFESGLFVPNHPFLEAGDIDFISQVIIEAPCTQRS